MAGRQGGNPRAAGAVDKKIGTRVRAHRLECAMSQETLAAKVGVTFQQIQKYEKGVNRIAAGTLMDIAQALDVSVMALLPPMHSSEAQKSLLDDPDVVEFLPLLSELNADGRRALTGVARSFAKDPKLCATDKRRRD